MICTHPLVQLVHTYTIIGRRVVRQRDEREERLQHRHPGCWCHKPFDYSFVSSRGMWLFLRSSRLLRSKALFCRGYRTVFCFLFSVFFCFWICLGLLVGGSGRWVDYCLLQVEDGSLE